MQRNLGIFLIALVLIQSCSAASNRESIKCAPRPDTPSLHSDGEYDFIVAGGGTAGNIVAARLSKHFTVLLIESGERLYDSAALNAQHMTALWMGVDAGSLANTLNPLLKGFGKVEGEHFIDENGKEIGHVKDGIPGFMPHVQGTPFMALFFGLTEACHNYPTVPQIYAQKREIDYPRGNVLGGSSAANTMVYFRGSKRDFDQWDSDFGLKGWNYDSVLPFFKRFENNQDVADTRVHGHSGLINITIVKNHFPSPNTDEYSKAAIKMGYASIEDASNPETVYGVTHSWQEFAGDNGRRSDSSAYLHHLNKQGKICWDTEKSKCGKEQTLHVWTKTFVTKLLLDGKRAYGVEYTANGGKSPARTEHPSKSSDTDEGVKHHVPFNKWDRIEVQKKNPILGAPVDKSLAFDWERTSEQYIPETFPDRSATAKRVTAKYEVILSTGTVETGKILMLAGIGPATHLRERGVPVVVDLPVGERLQDHQEVIVTYKFPESMVPPFDFVTETVKGFPTLRKHLAGERTFFSQNGVPAGLEGSSLGPKGTVPKFHLHHINVGGFENFDWNIASYPETMEAPSRLPRSILELYKWTGLKYHSHNCELSQNHAYGRLELRNTDPFQSPFLDPRYGASDEDNAEMVACIETVREIMKNSDPQFVGEELEPSRSAKTKEQLTQYVRNNVWGHHISGSTPMGNCTYEYSVVDGKGRVYGIDGLRVADASLFPTVPHGNPAGVVMMIGEKIADTILNDWKVKANTKSGFHDEL